ncbi:MAG: hypothetical protein ABIJ18_01260 [archaeon]
MKLNQNIFLVTLTFMIVYVFVIIYRAELGTDPFTEYVFGAAAPIILLFSIMLISVFFKTEIDKIKLIPLVFFYSFLIFILSLYLTSAISIYTLSLNNIFTLSSFIGSMLFIVRYFNEIKILGLWGNIDKFFERDIMHQYVFVGLTKGRNTLINTVIYGALLLGMIGFMLRISPNELPFNIFQQYGTIEIYLILLTSVVTGLIYGLVEKILYTKKWVWKKE